MRYPFSDPAARKRTVIAGGLFAAFFLLYGFTRDRTYAFDSLLYALAIRRPFSGIPVTAILSTNHFLWLPFIRSFFVILSKLGFTGGPYAAIQWLNTGIGALLAASVYLFLGRFVHRNWALLLALLAGLSHVVWLRATGGDPYLAGTLLAVFSCSLLTARTSEPGMPLLAGIALMCCAAAFLHIANIVLLPIILLVLVSGRSPQKWLNAAFVLFLAVVLFIPYVLFYDLYTPAGIKEWLAWGAGQVNGQAPGLSSSGQFDFHFLANIPVWFSTLAESLAALPVNGLALRLLLMAAAASACGWIVIDRARLRLDRDGALPPLAFFAGITGFFCVWMPGNIFYWAGPLVFFVLSLGLIFAPRLQNPPGRRAGAAAAVFLLGLGLLNFQRVIRPNMEGAEVKPLLELCETIKENTPSSSAILISGHRNGFLKVAIPYFAERKLLALDLLIIQYYGTGRDPLLEVKTRLDAYLKAGVPVYMLDDVPLAKGEFGAWGVPAGRIEALLGSYRLKEAARLTRPFPAVIYRLEK